MDLIVTSKSERISHWPSKARDCGRQEDDSVGDGSNGPVAGLEVAGEELVEGFPDAVRLEVR
jgi:hypothetical protein